jgi:tetratricopeptide (TPR) repeat protein
MARSYIIFTFRAAEFPEVVLRKNVKIIASLVRKAKKKLQQNKRDEALEFMKKAVDVDDNNGVLVQVIMVIGKKKPRIEPEEEPAETTVETSAEEPVETLQKTPEKVTVKQVPIPAEATVENNHERKSSMTSEDQLTKIFEASDREYENGHQQKAIAYLKRARKLDPDNPEVQSKIDLLKTKIKSANLVQIARKKLRAGEVAKAVVLARKAFEMMPETNGLDELLSDIENESETVSSPPGGSDAGTGNGNDTAAAEYIIQVRELVQSNLLEKAAYVARKAFSLHPNDKLLTEFIDNFKKLGLID